MARCIMGRSSLCLALWLVFATSGVLYGASSDSRACSNPPGPGFQRRSLAFDGGGQSCVEGSTGCQQRTSGDPPAAPFPVFAVQRLPPSASPQLPRKQCARSELAQPLHWISSAVWMSSVDEMLVVDGVSGRLLSVSPSGAISPRDGRISTHGLRGVAQLNDSFLLLYSDTSVLKINAFCSAVLARAFLRQSDDGRPNGLGDLDDWTVVGDELIGFGTIHAPGNDQFDLAFASARIGGSSPLTVTDIKALRRFDRQQYYLLGHHYVTSNSLGAFFLVMDDDAALFWYLPRTGEVRPVPGVLPPAFRTIKPLRTRFVGPADGEEHYAEVESLSIPVGIYGAGEFVYLLTREPEVRGGTIWKMHKIDPASKRLLGSVRLPTSAHHLSVVPTRDHWFFFEKGPVRKVGGQQVRSLVIVPAEWIEDVRASPLNRRVNVQSACVDLTREVREKSSGPKEFPRAQGSAPSGPATVAAAP